jgi:transposase
MSAYSLDFRERVVEMYAGGRGGSQRELAERFGISPATLAGWLRLERQTGALRPRPHGGGAPAKLSAAALAFVRQRVLHERGLYLRELQALVSARFGVTLSLAALCRLLQRLELRRKRRRSTRRSAMDRPSARSGRATGGGSPAGARRRAAD